MNSFKVYFIALKLHSHSRRRVLVVSCPSLPEDTIVTLHASDLLPFWRVRTHGSVRPWQLRYHSLFMDEYSCAILTSYLSFISRFSWANRYITFCVSKNEFGTTWGVSSLNDDRLFIFGWTILLSSDLVIRSAQLQCSRFFFSLNFSTSTGLFLHY